MRLHAAVLSLAATQALAQTYTQQYRWQGNSFFDAFNFFTDADPTHGFVKYVDAATAKKNNLIATSNSKAYMGVDYTSALAADGSGGGRQSVRLTSKATFNHGLFIGDFAHMPTGICGVWPAWWSFGPNWPSSGEIDIIEGVSKSSTNLMSLHAGPNCTTAGAKQSGTLVSADCYQYAPGSSGAGCGVADTRAASFSGFNAGGGGVFAMEWTASYIRTWFWPRGRVPADVARGAPAPSTWGTPAANFQGACDIPAHFREHSMVLDTTFCGDWAGNVWGADASCRALAPSCNAYVATKPGAFKNAFWLVNYIAVYQPTTPQVKIAAEALQSIAPNKQAAAAPSAVAAGATGPASPGVTAAAATAAPSALAQLPATANGTAGTDLKQRDGDEILVA